MKFKMLLDSIRARVTELQAASSFPQWERGICPSHKQGAVRASSEIARSVTSLPSFGFLPDWRVCSVVTLRNLDGRPSKLRHRTQEATDKRSFPHSAATAANNNRNHASESNRTSTAFGLSFRQSRQCGLLTEHLLERARRSTPEHSARW